MAVKPHEFCPSQHKELKPGIKGHVRYVVLKYVTDMNRKAGVIIFIISCLLFMLMVMLATTRYPPAIDIDILTAFKNLQTPLLTIFFRFVTWAGSLFFILPASVAIVYLLYRCQQHVDALFFSVSIISAIILTQLLKYQIYLQKKPT